MLNKNQYNMNNVQFKLEGQLKAINVQLFYPNKFKSGNFEFSNVSGYPV